MTACLAPGAGTGDVECRERLGGILQEKQVFERTGVLTNVVSDDNMGGGVSRSAMNQRTRPISWIKPALKDFEEFPEGARAVILAALTIAAEGRNADIAKPMHGMGSGVFAIALSFRADAFRVVYAVQLAEDIYVVHAFQKKSTQGIKTSKHDVDLIKNRLKTLREILR